MTDKSKLKRVVPWEPTDNGNEVATRLVRSKGTILLIVVDPEGNRVFEGDLISLGPNGFVRQRNVSPALGFQLDKLGRIVMDES